DQPIDERVAAGMAVGGAAATGEKTARLIHRPHARMCSPYVYSDCDHL
ncbi:unnamed protein product, partial [marine sediment metagenome]